VLVSYYCPVTAALPGEDNDGLAARVSWRRNNSVVRRHQVQLGIVLSKYFNTLDDLRSVSTDYVKRLRKLLDAAGPGSA